MGNHILCCAVFSLFARVALSTDSTVYWHPSSTRFVTSHVEALAAAPLSPTILYAGTWGGGIFRATDHDTTWITATAGLILPMHIHGGLVVNPVTPTVLFGGDITTNQRMKRIGIAEGTEYAEVGQCSQCPSVFQ